MVQNKFCDYAVLHFQYSRPMMGNV